MTVPELCVYTHNFFDRYDDPTAGEFTFTADTVPAGVSAGPYLFVCGSIFNDGVHKAGDGDLTPETFTGTVQPMRVPPDFVALAQKITDYDAAPPAVGAMFPSPSTAGAAPWPPARTSCPQTAAPTTAGKSTNGGNCNACKRFH